MDAQRMQLEGKWDQMKGKVKEAWGSLTDDELDQSKGQWDQLVGSIKERTGETQADIESRLSQLLSDDDDVHREYRHNLTTLWSGQGAVERLEHREECPDGGGVQQAAHHSWGDHQNQLAALAARIPGGEQRAQPR